MIGHPLAQVQGESLRIGSAFPCFDQVRDNGAESVHDVALDQLVVNGRDDVNAASLEHSADGPRRRPLVIHSERSDSPARPAKEPGYLGGMRDCICKKAGQTPPCDEALPVGGFMQ